MPEPLPLSPTHDPWHWRPGQGRCLERQVSLMRLRGRDTRRFLHGQTSADVLQAPPERWLKTCCVTPTARMMGLARLRLESDGSGGDMALLAVESGDPDAIYRSLDRVLFPADQVVLEPPSPATLRLALAGDGHSLASVVGGGTAAFPPPADALVPLSEQESERWRIQWGWPGHPAEINNTHNPFELGLADAVSLSKGCYVGQETLARLATYDGVRQQLRRWYCTTAQDEPLHEGSDGRTEPAQGRLTAGGALITRAGERAGIITSSLSIDMDGTTGRAVVGLAMVRRAALSERILLATPLQGEGTASPPALRISAPSGFVEPPVGSGGRA